MLPSARELSALIGAVYEAGLDPTGAAWPAVLARLSPVIAGDGTVVLALERRRFDYAYTHYARTDADSVARYQAYYAGVDPVFEPLLQSAPPGELLLSAALMPARQLRRTEFYADWLRPHEYGAGAAAVVARCGSAKAALYAVRPRRRGPFEPRDVEALRLLLPHVAAAVRVSLRLASLGADRDVAAAALDHWDEAMLLVDGLGRVLAANRAAEALLRGGDGLTLEPGCGLGRGRLRAATPGATAALRRVVAAAAAVATAPLPARSAGPSPPGRRAALALVRPSGRPPLAAYVAPLSPRGAASAAWTESLAPDVLRATAVIFVADPAVAGDGIAARERLRATYRLTAAEAAVAVAVARGDGLLAVAAAQGVGLATVRTQAQHVYRKTGVRGQVALARLVERLAHAL
jgi:DNA-binding CsgD family transcriptional regulator/PAS domain-containing protein